jgi:hypothetical protein
MKKPAFMSRAKNESSMILNQGEIEYACLPGGQKKAQLTRKLRLYKFPFSPRKFVFSSKNIVNH